MRTCAARTFVKISSALWSTRILTLPRRTESWRNASSALLTTSVLEDLHSLRRSGAQCPHVPDRRTGSIQARSCKSACRCVAQSRLQFAVVALAGAVA